MKQNYSCAIANMYNKKLLEMIRTIDSEYAEECLTELAYLKDESENSISEAIQHIYNDVGSKVTSPIDVAIMSKFMPAFYAYAGSTTRAAMCKVFRLSFENFCKIARTLTPRDYDFKIITDINNNDFALEFECGNNLYSSAYRVDTTCYTDDGNIIGTSFYWMNFVKDEIRGVNSHRGVIIGNTKHICIEAKDASMCNNPVVIKDKSDEYPEKIIAEDYSYSIWSSKIERNEFDSAMKFINPNVLFGTSFMKLIALGVLCKLYKLYKSARVRKTDLKQEDVLYDLTLMDKMPSGFTPVTIAQGNEKSIHFIEPKCTNRLKEYNPEIFGEKV